MTVAPENIADLEETYYTNLSVMPTLGVTHVVTWAVRANSPRLREALDGWIERTRDTRQLMPATAQELGVSDPWNPEENAMGAVRDLRWLATNYWDDEIAEPAERLKFILASYNVGAGHVLDARRLAEAEGDDPDLWSDVAYWLLQKSRADVYSRPEVRYGFCRGLEPVQYVARILDRFAHYRQFVRAGRPATS